ncbi:MAG: phage virion morphogenesis protein [Candidatus Kapabacteria bacterium]|nr:phage virion morphogenesis protein [Candidatus Kapabacteria bacterium]MBX3043155.1 phage virion morphogenesis protein [Ignavibacteriota bacterium]MCW5884856.1 phage virion morphogenesis protein [Candidatus Kapabacteria bacterium]
MISNDITNSLSRKFIELQKQFDDLTPVLEVVSALIERAISENFDGRGRWDGNENDITIFSGGSQKWKALASSTKEKYQRLGWELEPTLNRSKGLMSTIEVRPQGKSSIVISANSPYAAIHQYGGTLTPTILITSKMRKFFWAKYYNTGLVNWKVLALTKKKELKPVIQIPARPYITLTEEDLEEILELLTNRF